MGTASPGRGLNMLKDPKNGPAARGPYQGPTRATGGYHGRPGGLAGPDTPVRDASGRDDHSLGLD
jgi:hypothetical protein